MRYLQLLGSAAALVHSVSAQAAASTVACDSLTKICYSSYFSTSTGIRFGIALPMNVSDAYDAIISITAPIATTWAGFAWGGTMVFNPLTVAWPNGKSGTVSSRFA